MSEIKENILYKFAKDLSQLYAKTGLKIIEDSFIRIAQSYEEEIEKWISKGIQTDVKSSLRKPEVIDTLILLIKLKKSYPAGLAHNDFIKLFINDTYRRQFIPMIVAIREVSKTSNYAILNPYKDLLEASKNFPASTSEGIMVSDDIKVLDNSFRDYLEREANKTYEDAPVVKRKFNKKEKIGNLLHFLTNKFSEEIAISYDQIGEMDIMGITSDPSVLLNPVKIIETLFPNYPKENIKYLYKWSTEIVNEVMKHLDPFYHDYIYNYIRNKIMYFGAQITYEQFQKFKYESVINLHTSSPEDKNETVPLEVSPEAWKWSQNLILLSFVLYMLMSKSH